MKTLIIFNHPYEGSYCNAILTACTQGLAEKGCEYDIINLDKEGFNPITSARELQAFAIAHKSPKEAQEMLSPQVLEYALKLKQTSHLVFIFPIWWMLMPALTKGFIDKVLFPGIVYNYDDKGNMKGLLQNIKEVTVITTTAATGKYYKEKLYAPVWMALLHGTFNAIGINNCRWINIDNIKNLTNEERAKQLEEIKEYFTRQE